MNNFAFECTQYMFFLGEHNAFIIVFQPSFDKSWALRSQCILNEGSSSNIMWMQIFSISF